MSFLEFYILYTSLFQNVDLMNRPIVFIHISLRVENYEKYYIEADTEKLTFG